MQFYSNIILTLNFFEVVWGTAAVRKAVRAMLPLAKIKCQMRAEEVMRAMLVAE
jgi:hypothetical protein